MIAWLQNLPIGVVPKSHFNGWLDLPSCAAMYSNRCLLSGYLCAMFYWKLRDLLNQNFFALKQNMLRDYE
jgi:hypothetical protein